MAEFDRARVQSHMSRWMFPFTKGFPMKKPIAIIRGIQQAVNAPIATASV